MICADHHASTRARTDSTAASAEAGGALPLLLLLLLFELLLLLPELIRFFLLAGEGDDAEVGEDRAAALAMARRPCSDSSIDRLSLGPAYVKGES